MSPKIDYKSLDELVYEKIKAIILNKKLNPGTKIVQNQLAKKFGVSRTPIRRALSQLAKEHLGEINPRRGNICKKLFSGRDDSHIGDS